MNVSSTDQSRFFDWKMLVVLCAALLGGVLLVGCDIVTNPADKSGRNAMIKADLAALASALRLYSLKSGRFPTNEQGLRALLERPILEPIPEHWAQQVTGFEALKDPWDKEYVYSLGSDEQGFQLHSMGSDRLDSNEDDISIIFETESGLNMSP